MNVENLCYSNDTTEIVNQLQRLPNSVVLMHSCTRVPEDINTAEIVLIILVINLFFRNKSPHQCCIAVVVIYVIDIVVVAMVTCGLSGLREGKHAR